MYASHRTLRHALLVLTITGNVVGQQKTETSQVRAIPYLKLTTPRHVMPEAQKWEGDQFPHTLSVLELKRGGFRYWGWYGLNEGRGIGLARPSVLAKADPKHKDLLYFAITRDYDTPSSHIVLASSKDGIHLSEEKVLVWSVPNQRNQNPNLFRDPRSGRSSPAAVLPGVPSRHADVFPTLVQLGARLRALRRRKVGKENVGSPNNRLFPKG